MDETTYLNDNGVVVTSTRIELDGQTFAVRNIGSVKVTKPGIPWLAAFLGLLGMSMAISGTDGARIFGLMLLGGAAFWVYQQVRMRRLVLVSGGGETIALKSTNGAHMEKIRAAVAQAISAR